MIDKITPRSSAKVQGYLKELGFGDTELIHTEKGTYAAFVNAENAQYLVIEDTFPTAARHWNRLASSLLTAILSIK